MVPKSAPSKHSRGLSDLATRPELRKAIERVRREVGTRLRDLREELELTQEEAAERAGIHPKYLSRVENGTANPSLGVLVGLTNGYGVSLAELFPTGA